MKKPNIDLSQEGLQTFLLHHIEKVILGGSIAALAFLIWNGWGTEKYTKTEPAKLSQLATRAKTHIDTDSWTKMEEFREADDKADDRIKAANKFKTDADQYAVRRLIGTPRATLGLRTDPELITATDLIAKPFTSSVLIDMKYNKNYVSALSRLSSATSVDGESEDEGENQQGSAGGNIGESAGDDEDDKKKDEDRDPFGNTLTDVQKLEMVGLRPQATQTGMGGGGGGKPFVLDGIAVTGVVNFGEQFKKYETALRNAMGYYPLRDRPVYLYMQVQRREFDANPADQEAYEQAWVDISEQFYDNIYGVEQAPEVVAPVHYDPRLTRNIPPLVNYDYRKLAVHPKTEFRDVVPDAALKNRNVVKKFDASAIERNILGGGTTGDESADNKTAEGDEKEVKEKEPDVNDMKGSSRVLYEKINPLSRPKADLKLVRFFDFMARPGKSYQYRVRLWLNDPNDSKGDTEGGTEVEEDDDQQRGSAMNPSEGGDGDAETEMDEDKELLNAKHVKLSNNLLEQAVRTRIGNKENELPKFNFRGITKNADNATEVDAETKRREEYVKKMKKLLASAWATPWSEPTPPVKAGSTPAEFYAGTVVPPQTQRYEDFELPKTEPAANLVTSFWSNQTHTPPGDTAYNTAIPSLKTVYRGDVLNYKVKKAHILDPSDGSVKRVKDTKIQSDAVVLDMMGGDEVGRFEFPVEIATEVLVMDAAGNLRVQNNYRDRIGFRHSLFLPDEDNEYGKPRKNKKKDRNVPEF